jgi:hypothetical protein
MTSRHHGVLDPGVGVRALDRLHAHGQADRAAGGAGALGQAASLRQADHRVGDGGGQAEKGGGAQKLAAADLAVLELLGEFGQVGVCVLQKRSEAHLFVSQSDAGSVVCYKRLAGDRCAENVDRALASHSCSLFGLSKAPFANEIQDFPCRCEKAATAMPAGAPLRGRLRPHTGVAQFRPTLTRKRPAAIEGVERRPTDATGIVPVALRPRDHPASTDTTAVVMR